MTLTTEHIRNGFWYFNPENQWPPPSLQCVEDYRPTEKLSLSITQTKLKPSEQQKQLEKWCRLLPTLKEVKYLWFVSKVNQAMFEAACKMPNLEGLFIKWSSINSIDTLKQLSKLKHFRLGSSSQVMSIEVLKTMTTLVTLDLEQLNLISDFSDVGHLTQLEGLGLNGSIWTPQKIDTIEPLRKLKKVKYLTLVNTRLQDKSFDPLLGLHELVTFRISGNYLKTEFEKIKELPHLTYGNIEYS